MAEDRGQQRYVHESFSPTNAGLLSERLHGDLARMTTEHGDDLTQYEIRVLEMLGFDSYSKRIAPGLPLRLHAARLRAGFATAESAAFPLEVQGRNYRSAENGSRKPSPHILAKASQFFGVSMTYLLLAQIERAEDVEAAEIEKIIEALRTTTWSSEKEIGDRLKNARREAGFRTADEALAESGWKPSAYKAHEAGFKPITVDRLVLYARRFGVDPRMLAYDHPQTGEVAATSSVAEFPMAGNILQPGRQTSPRKVTYRAWPWLTTPILSNDVVAMQVLLMSGNGLLVPAAVTLTIPTRVPAFRDPSIPVFAVLATEEGNGLESRYLIVQPCEPNAEERGLVVSDVAGIRSGVLASERLMQGDPLTVPGSVDNPLVLGKQIGVLSLRWESDVNRAPAPR